MEQFSVKLSGMEQRIDEEQRIANSLNSIESRIWSVRNALSFEIGSKENIKKALSNLATNVNEHESDMRTMRSVLNNIRNQYEKTENRICGNIGGWGISINEIWDSITSVGAGLAVTAIPIGLPLPQFIQDLINDPEIEMKYGDFERTIKEKEKKFKEDKFKESSYVYDEETDEWIKQKDDDDSKKDEKDTPSQIRNKILNDLTIFSISRTKDASLFSGEAAVDGKWGNAQASVDVLKAEATAGLSLTGGGLNAELGVALTAFTASASGQLGNDMLGLHGSAEVTAGKVEAKVEADFSWINEDGEIDPNFGVSASAEAIALEAEAKVGVDLLGTEINGSASVNIGVGAHADIGFRDGKLKFDVGASLGIGFSVDLEIDVSGTIDAVADFASDIGETAQAAYETVSNAIGDAADAVSDAIDDFADAAADAWNKGWSTFTSWF